MRFVVTQCRLAVLLLFCSALTLLGQGPSETYQGRAVAAHEALVKFRTPNGLAIWQAQTTGDIDEAEPVGNIPNTHRVHSRSKTVNTLLQELSGRNDVAYAEPNYIVHINALPNDPDFSSLWGMQNISATSAWEISTGSLSNVVAVVDSGIDYNHPDLAINVWSAPASFTVNIGGKKTTCAAGTHGFNAILHTCDPMDDNNHGTHVSGTIGAVGNNGVGVVGVNWVAQIMAVKFLDSTGSGTTANAINAIEFAIQAKAAFASTNAANVRVLSNSWGGTGFSQALLDEINKANTHEMLFVAAAGNSATDNDVTPTYPASFTAPNVIAVAANDNPDALAYFSNYGPATVHLSAPGVNVLSTIPGGAYQYDSGTSMATPHVSGAALLLLSRCSLNTASLKTTLLNNVDLPPGAGRHNHHRRTTQRRQGDSRVHALAIRLHAHGEAGHCRRRGRYGCQLDDHDGKSFQRLDRAFPGGRAEHDIWLVPVHQRSNEWKLHRSGAQPGGTVRVPVSGYERIRR